VSNSFEIYTRKWMRGDSSVGKKNSRTTNNILYMKGERAARDNLNGKYIRKSVIFSKFAPLEKKKQQSCLQKMATVETQ